MQCNARHDLSRPSDVFFNRTLPVSSKRGRDWSQLPTFQIIHLFQTKTKEFISRKVPFSSSAARGSNWLITRSWGLANPGMGTLWTRLRGVGCGGLTRAVGPELGQKLEMAWTRSELGVLVAPRGAGTDMPRWRFRQSAQAVSFTFVGRCPTCGLRAFEGVSVGQEGHRTI
jgi:hypothetical protein